MPPHPSSPSSSASTDAAEPLIDREEQRAVLGRIVKSAARLVDATEVVVLMVRPARGELASLDCSYRGSGFPVEGLRTPVHAGDVGGVFDSGKPAILSSDEGVLAEVLPVTRKRALLVPIEHATREDNGTASSIRIGVLVALRNREPFDEEDARILANTARQLSQGIAFTELYSAAADAIEQYESAIHGMSTGFMAFTTDGILFQSNRTMELIGVTREDTGKHYRAVFANLPPFLTEMVDRTLTRGEPGLSEIKLMVGEEGQQRERMFRIQMDPLKSDSGDQRRGGAVMLMQDVSFLHEQHAVQESLVPVILHDMRNPLTSIYGFAETLLMTLPESSDIDKESLEFLLADLREFLPNIRDAAKRSTRIADDFLDIYRLAAGQPLAVKPDTFDLPQVLASLLEEKKQEISPSSGVQLVLEIDPSVGEIYADRGRVEQVVLNFLSNAVKYSPKGGTVTLKAAPVGDRVRVSVKDEGIGIPADALPKMFGEFFRVESDAHKGIKGTGLGLFLCKKLIDIQDGEIGVESKYGEGSEFFFLLPVRPG